MTRAPISEILVGAHVTKLLIIGQIDKFILKTRAKRSYGTCDEAGRAKSSSKILRINRLISKEKSEA